MSYCEYCRDGEGGCAFPMYGTGPHVCGWRMGKPAIGHSVTAPREEWPANFEEDPEDPCIPGKYPGSGVYTHCLHCGAGAKPLTKGQP